MTGFAKEQATKIFRHSYKLKTTLGLRTKGTFGQHVFYVVLKSAAYIERGVVCDLISANLLLNCLPCLL